MNVEPIFESSSPFTPNSKLLDLHACQVGFLPLKFLRIDKISVTKI